MAANWTRKFQRMTNSGLSLSGLTNCGLLRNVRDREKTIINFNRLDQFFRVRLRDEKPTHTILSGKVGSEFNVLIIRQWSHGQNVGREMWYVVRLHIYSAVDR